MPKGRIGKMMKKCRKNPIVNPLMYNDDQFEAALKQLKKQTNLSYDQLENYYTNK